MQHNSTLHAQTTPRNIVMRGGVLTTIPSGQKGPTATGWNRRENGVDSVDDIHKINGHNIGLLHAYSGTCAVDVDDLEEAVKILTPLGFDLRAELADGRNVQIDSGKPNRAKLLYRMPPEIPFMITKQMGPYELRSGTAEGLSVQDVLPPSTLADGRVYKWKGAGYADMPVIPAALMRHWTALITGKNRTVGGGANVVTEETKEPVGMERASITSMLGHLASDRGGRMAEDREDWIQVGMALHHETGGSKEGLRLWDAFSSRSEKYREGEPRAKWGSFRFDNSSGVVTLRTLIKKARSTGWVEQSKAKPAVEEDPDDLATDTHGNIIASLDNVARALTMPGRFGYDFRFDTFKNEKQITRPGGQWELLSDTVVSTLRRHFENNGFKPITKAMMEDSIASLQDDTRYQSDTLKDHIVKHAGTWDGVGRIDTFLVDDGWCDDDDAGYTRAFGRSLWSAMAARATVPGSKVDTVFVLHGAQGVGKSSLVKALAFEPSFYKSLSFALSEADIARHIMGSQIVELEELEGLTKKEVTSVKKMISTSTDDFVNKYEKHRTRYPRRCVWIGTTNEQEILRDTTGNRRWVPITLTTTDTSKEGINAKIDRLRARLPQLWAEAVYKHERDGIDLGVIELAKEREQDYMVKSPVVDGVRAWMARSIAVVTGGAIEDTVGTPLYIEGRPFKTYDCMKGIEDWRLAAGAARNFTRRQVTEALRQLGFVQRVFTVNKKNVRCWAKPTWSVALLKD